MEEQQERINAIKDRIHELVAKRVAADQICYLAGLGTEIAADLKFLREELHLSLSGFVQSHMSDSYILIPVGGKSGSLALFPRDGTEVSASWGSVAEKKSQVRFVRDLWLAFALPSRGTPRYFHPEKVALLDGAPSEGEEGWLEIQGDLLRGEQDEYDAEKIANNIRDWLAAHQLSESNFRAASLSSAPDRIPGANQRIAPANNCLELFISALDQRQLRAVSLPMDVVASLLKKSI